MYLEKLKLKGEFVLEVIGKEGVVKAFREVKNIITDVGKAQVAGLINGVVTTPFKYIAIGSGTTSPTAGDTALEAEVARKTATVDRVTTNVTNDTAYLEATFSSADGLSGSMSITESGVFDADTGGNMLCRQTFDAVSVNWDAGDQLTIKWKIVVS
ncbi:MAG: hypothetical protein DRO23_05670 [Thermoprotei archaeon]|nr:MAG: hypothetical protein DRO23_05670 [Thermoprotei archaeon]